MRVFITDTTLREGIQSASLELSYEKREELFYLIASTGVHELEVGVPAHSEEEREYIKRLVRSPYGDRVIVWNRANPGDVERSLECGVRRVEIAFPVSDIMLREKLRKDRQYIWGLASDILPCVKSGGVYLSVGFEDASRAEGRFLYSFAQHVKALGADRIRLSDTVGLFNPLRVRSLVRKVSSIIDVEVHFHNDFGMATANSITAVLSGARYVNTSLLGLGERCGIAPMEEVVFYLQIVQGVETGVDLRRLYEVLCGFVRETGLGVHPDKPILGRNAFLSKSSIHIDGLLKSGRTYLPFNPELIGRKAGFVCGEYSKKPPKTPPSAP